MMKARGDMGIREIIFTITPVLWIIMLLRADLIHGQTTADPHTGSTVTPSISAMSASTMSEEGTGSISTLTTMMMATTGGFNTGDNATTVNTEGATAVTTTPPDMTQPTPGGNEDNFTTTMSPSDMANSTLMPDMANSTLTLDMGNLMSTPDMGNSTSTPDMENSTITPDMGNSTLKPDMGNVTSTLDMGNLTSTQEMNSTSPESEMNTTTSTSDMENSTSTSDIGNSTSSDTLTTDEYDTVTMTSEYTDIITDVPEAGNSTDTLSAETNITMGTTIWNNSTVDMNTTINPKTTSASDGDPRKRTGPSIPVALYMCISVILALCVVLLMGVIAHACASMRGRPTSYDVSSRVNGHQNPAFDSGEVADDDEDNPVKGIMREPRVDIESGMYSDNERTPL